ncbi:MAG: RNA polymerase sigma factor [Roseobacter sp.]|jgi:RNA polymerase sigma-70 factor (ECF subfamily)|nr:RNA polymerase sigma factor [Roseobacter sp.]
MPFDPDTSPTDDQLLVHYAAGDPTAAAELTARFLPRVYGHARRMLGDSAEAEDVAQDAMLKLWQMAPTWRSGHAKVSTWLYRVTANLCTDRLRRRRGVPLDQVAEPEDEGQRAEGRLQEHARRDALQVALDSLPPRQRQAVLLRHLEGLGNPEIAQIMEITPRAVESLTARGKRALADALAIRKDALGYTDDTT